MNRFKIKVNAGGFISYENNNYILRQLNIGNSLSYHLLFIENKIFGFNIRIYKK